MRVLRWMVAVAVVAAMPQVAQASGVEARLGVFFPSAQSDLFDDATELYTVGRGDFEGVYGGIEFALGLGHHVEIGVAIDGYNKTRNTSYRNFVDADGFDIHQTLELTTVPVGLTLRFVAGGPHARVAPYLGVGADAVFWEYEAYGDFIDFYDPDLPIRSDAFVSQGVAPGLHVAGGLRLGMTHDLALTLEGRYQWVDEDDMDGDFSQNRIDVSGWSATMGLRLGF